MSRSSGSPRLARILSEMEVGETRMVDLATRSQLESSVRIHCRAEIMREIRRFTVFERKSQLYVTRGENL